ncbi:hypothetical protein KPZU09_41800 [Klebsiella pneumoniae]|uniref:phosphoserine phosphatase n=1 Tax=Klebsiella pneumoniae TaxID=573 RepID=A0A919HTM6_KLEPN|nr:hypothetical protein KPZU09_41800 [Klebsiella pneumoniae]
MIRLAGSLTPRATRLAHEAGLDVAPLGKIPHLRTPGLLVMDMDSTAIQIECIDEIAKLAGTGELVSEVTERAMRGELDFTASLRQRVATLKDADASILLQVRDALPLMPGGAAGAQAGNAGLESGDRLRRFHLLCRVSARQTASRRGIRQ